MLGEHPSQDFGTAPDTKSKLVAGQGRRCAVHHVQEQGLSQRRACRLVNQPRGTQRYQATQCEDEDALTRAVVELASQCGRYTWDRVKGGRLSS